MTVFSTPPRPTTYTITTGNKPNVPAWAVQRFLNSLGIAKISEDGVFGLETEQAVKAYQSQVGIAKDGVVGPATQARMARSCRFRADKDETTPRGMIDGLIAGESGGYIAAVNWSVPNGCDCGFTQRRIYEPYTDVAIKRAFDAVYQVQLLVDQFIERYATFYSYPYVASRDDRYEYAWRLAALNHNWPYAAGQLALGKQLSDQVATWVPAGVKFEDGSPVISFRDWAKKYAMGSRMHNERGLVMKQAFGVPADG